MTTPDGLIALLYVLLGLILFVSAGVGLVVHEERKLRKERKTDVTSND